MALKIGLYGGTLIDPSYLENIKGIPSAELSEF